MADIMTHPWMNEGHALPFGPAPFPNKIGANDIDEDISEHMVVVLKVNSLAEILLPAMEMGPCNICMLRDYYL